MVLFYRLCTYLLIIAGIMCPTLHAESLNDITIAPYIPHEAGLSPKEAEATMTMLNRMMTASGCAGAGFDNRFIIVPHIRQARCEVVGLDSKAVVELDVNLFIGDGVSGTLFASTSFTLKGIGATLEQARVSALHKGPSRSKELLDFINMGKDRIAQYYEQHASSIISTAKSLAQRHEYENAITSLFTIPPTCSHYAEAQKLAGEYGLKYVNSRNDNAIRLAQQVWNANPTREGAAEAIEAMNAIAIPTTAQKAEIDKLLKSMDNKFSLRETREYQLRLAGEKNRHAERMSAISSRADSEKALYKAAASVARAYVSSRPRAIYNLSSWF